MRGLVRVELTRLRWRRAVLLLLLACLVVPALIAAATLWDTRPVSEAEKAEIRAASTQEIARCERKPRQYGVRPARAEARCPELVVEWQTARQPLSLARERGGSGIGVAGALTVLLMLAATTFAGHDWNSGSMSNQLLFRPRRGRVWAAKAVAVTGVALLTAVLVSTAYWLTMWAAMRARDLPVADGGLSASLGLGLRGAGLAAAAALGCYALTMLLRSTVATLGVVLAFGFATLVLGDSLPMSGQWEPLDNIAAVLANGTEYYVHVPPSCYDGRYAQGRAECDDIRELPLWRGATYYGGAVVLVGAASVLSFRRRDVP
ncbi:hypothetical protein [Nocardioides deserti]|uniref:ABC transporter permease n=1 Tax=Nocardioides deserti TaxID=1588644 RepID=A0ABR6U6F2_9ACTN|nr:hypothetical protein [Nocardioides deserti]MBC2960014.1 hypothetical protein [Nocardioides deserti]GGO75185.1 hypothetical protein GCM10012276_24940 [Nocardioides deserti]